MQHQRCVFVFNNRTLNIAQELVGCPIRYQMGKIDGCAHVFAKKFVVSHRKRAYQHVETPWNFSMMMLIPRGQRCDVEATHGHAKKAIVWTISFDLLAQHLQRGVKIFVLYEIVTIALQTFVHACKRHHAFSFFLSRGDLHNAFDFGSNFSWVNFPLIPSIKLSFREQLFDNLIVDISKFNGLNELGDRGNDYKTEN